MTASNIFSISLRYFGSIMPGYHSSGNGGLDSRSAGGAAGVDEDGGGAAATGAGADAWTGVTRDIARAWLVPISRDVVRRGVET